MRKSDGAKCLPMDAYMIISAKSRIADDITRIFPGCGVVPWNPIKMELTGHTKRAVEFVRDAVKRGETWIALQSIYNALGVTRTNFNKLVRRKDKWVDTISELRLEEDKGPNGRLGLRAIGQFTTARN
jgi:hypothetical protein